MRNAYLTSHFPLISIVFFSLAAAVYLESLIMSYLRELGLYSGMVEFFSEQGITITIVITIWLFFFMLFAALKLIADTVNELSLLFFSKEEEGVDYRIVKKGSWIFLAGSIASLLLSFEIQLAAGAFLLSCTVYFIYFVYRVSMTMGPFRLMGLIFFHLFFWSAFFSVVGYILLRLYTSVVASLPI
ncbi:DUF5366 family protein [Alkalicoccus chagannorensis]|uniref:DUF5366 family protein n=1 Tax=Alkalicoccus chagannorensis TaxID=427072 RepID=UPI00041A14BB|nr:DUF5366 family protein [Alkalicoccus chagannorensis]